MHLSTPLPCPAPCCWRASPKLDPVTWGGPDLVWHLGPLEFVEGVQAAARLPKGDRWAWGRGVSHRQGLTVLGTWGQASHPEREAGSAPGPIWGGHAFGCWARGVGGGLSLPSYCRRHTGPTCCPSQSPKLGCALGLGRALLVPGDLPAPPLLCASLPAPALIMHLLCAWLWRWVSKVGDQGAGSGPKGWRWPGGSVSWRRKQCEKLGGEGRARKVGAQAQQGGRPCGLGGPEPR